MQQVTKKGEHIRDLVDSEAKTSIGDFDKQRRLLRDPEVCRWFSQAYNSFG